MLVSEIYFHAAIIVCVLAVVLFYSCFNFLSAIIFCLVVVVLF